MAPESPAIESPFVLSLSKDARADDWQPRTSDVLQFGHRDYGGASFDRLRTNGVHVSDASRRSTALVPDAGKTQWRATTITRTDVAQAHG